MLPTDFRQIVIFAEWHSKPPFFSYMSVTSKIFQENSIFFENYIRAPSIRLATNSIQ
jgi:hypothetical protein